MSILLDCEDGWILSHLRFFENIEINSNSGTTTLNPVSTVTLNPNLFEIQRPFVRRLKTKRCEVNDPTDDDRIPSHTEDVRTYFSKVMDIAKLKKIFDERTCSTEEDDDNNTAARQAAVLFYKEMNLNFIGQGMKFNGANNTDHGVVSQLAGHSFIFPKHTTFYCGSINEVIQKHFSGKDHTPTFDFVLIDPPWKNKYIWRNVKRRQMEGGGYKLLDNPEIESIQLDKICSDGALVVVWCTNASSHHDDLIKTIFPRWNVSYLTTWYWVKVTTSGIPVCPFNSTGKKQPYECIIIGKYRARDQSGESQMPGNSTDFTHTHPDLRTMKVIVSVPSSLHSHKPPLIQVFSKYLSPVPKCCELFGRYLVPGITSIGNEVIKLQHSSLYAQTESS